MIMDIVEVREGADLGLARSDIARAGNVLSVQLGSLYFAPGFGVDLKYFLQSEYQFQNESFQAYLVNRLVESQVNVVQCVSVVETFYHKYVFEIGQPNNTQGFIL